VFLPPLVCGAQESKGSPPELQAALAGSWAGILEYRDFSEAPGSTRRTKLPVWLTVEPSGSALRFAYSYDDGPGKTVTETQIVRIDADAGTYTVVGEGDKRETVYAVSPLAQLKEGRGTLTLRGSATENGVAVQALTTMRIGRNLIEMTRETGPVGTPLSFRHAYTLTRISPAGGGNLK
jgi:hypothetical protein